jgi:hypothetical protein
MRFILRCRVNEASPAAAAKPDSAPTPAGWGKDTLSEFLGQARDNQFATFAQKSDWYRRLSTIDNLFVVATKQWNPRDTLAAALFLRCHAAFRAACGLAMARQIVEAAVMHRSCLENAAYAVHINRNPRLGPLWLNRHQDAATLKKVRQEFAIENVRKTIAACNKDAAKHFDVLYQRAIDFGGHPNERGVMGSMEMEKLPDRRQLKAIFLHADGVPLSAALKTTAQCGANSLEILQCAFNALFEIVGVNAALLEARKGL